MHETFTIALGQHSEAGKKSENQDSYGILVPDARQQETKGIAAIIADGLSSSIAGKQASESSVRAFLSDYFSTPDSWSVKHSALKVLTALNSWLYSQGQMSPDPDRGLTSTLTALVLKSTTAHIFHVGDTRIYRLRDGVMEPLTRDHHTSLPGNKHYLARAMGVDTHLDIDYIQRSVQVDDCFIFTSDGVHEYLHERDMVKSITRHPDDLDSAAREIVQLALSNASPDNLTCQILWIKSIPQQAADEVFRELTKLPFPPPLETGMILDGYRIIEEIHASPTSQLHLAEDFETKMQVVIKTPSENYQDDPAYLERFLQETWVGKRVHGPHVVKVIEQTRPRTFLYCVMEFVKGQLLRDWMARNPEPELSIAIGLIKQIAAGLRTLHRLDMLHQDLKPENVIIDTTGMAKIIDFGSVRIAGIAEITSPVERVNMLGTKNYIAPEYLLGKSGTQHSDLFSLGVLSYQMLTGKLPYGEKLGRESSERAMRHLHYIPSPHLNPMIPVWMDGAIEKAVRIDPQRRHKDVTEFIYDLEHPNPIFMHKELPPLIERNPVAFWRALALLLFISDLVLLYFLVG